MLHICSEHFEQKDDEGEKEKSKDAKEKDKDKNKDKKEGEKTDDGSHQGVAVLGIALVAMGEEIGAQMALRTFNHLVSILMHVPRFHSNRNMTYANMMLLARDKTS